MLMVDGREQESVSIGVHLGLPVACVLFREFVPICEINVQVPRAFALERFAGPPPSRATAGSADSSAGLHYGWEDSAGSRVGLQLDWRRRGALNFLRNPCGDRSCNAPSLPPIAGSFCENTPRRSEGVFMPHKPGHRLRPRADMKFFVDLPHVGVDRPHADAEFLGDLFGPMALGQEPQDCRQKSDVRGGFLFPLPFEKGRGSR